MNENSMLAPAGGRSLLADSSVFDSKITETSKENIFSIPTDVDEDMPQIETRVILVQDAGKNEALLKALEEIKLQHVITEAVEEYVEADAPEFENVFV
ncbi:unnamed protein product, partial [Staurois parvus]